MSEDLEVRVRRLEAIEQIRLLKAQYFRCVDFRRWDEFADLFTEDLEVDFLESTTGPKSKAEFVASAARHFASGYSVHHGHEPEIEIIDESHATGLWPMYDRVESPSDSGYASHEGWGHYSETYRRCDDGRWRISSSRLTRIERHVLPENAGRPVEQPTSAAPSPTELPRPIIEFFDAVNARDFDALARCLADDIAYHLLMPHPPVLGRDAVVDALRASLTAADRVSWEPGVHLAQGDRAFVERVDRFWFGAHEAAIEVTGVFELTGESISAIRDYADLQTWRQRKAAAVNAGRPGDERE